MAKLLLIEPDRVLAKTFGESLARGGHSISLCYGAQAAIASADADKPDVVVVELQLAAHNGVEFIYEFRSYTEWQNIPVIILSRVPMADTSLNVAAQRELGISAYLYKPSTSLPKLLHAVDAVLQPS